MGFLSHEETGQSMVKLGVKLLDIAEKEEHVWSELSRDLERTGNELRELLVQVQKTMHLMINAPAKEELKVKAHELLEKLVRLLDHATAALEKIAPLLDLDEASCAPVVEYRNSLREFALRFKEEHLSERDPNPLTFTQQFDKIVTAYSAISAVLEEFARGAQARAEKEGTQVRTAAGG